jgi:hypothetical protein
MMTPALLGSILGSIATLAVAAIGFYQWRRTGKERGAQKFNEKKAAILEELVRRLQDLQIISRQDAAKPLDLTNQTRGLNEFLIANRLWLDPDDERQARNYLAALSAINAAVISGSNEDTEIFMATADGPFSDSVAEEFRQLAEAERALVERARNAAKRL